jgi:hypothetical protein
LNTPWGFAGARGGREAVETPSFQDAVDGVSVQVREEVRHHEGEVVEREACCPAQGANDRPFLLAGLPGQLMGPRGAVLAVGRASLAPLADGLGGHTVTAGQHARGLRRSGDLSADGGGGAGVGVDGVHQRLLAEQDRPKRSKRQAYSSSAHRT